MLYQSSNHRSLIQLPNNGPENRYFYIHIIHCCLLIMGISLTLLSAVSLSKDYWAGDTTQ